MREYRQSEQQQLMPVSAVVCSFSALKLENEYGGPTLSPDS